MDLEELKKPDFDEFENSPIEQVRPTVPTTDDPTLPCLTFRTWVLGIASCVFLSFANKFFSLRLNTVDISPVSAQIVSLPLGKLMAATLPTKPLRVPMTKWSFTLNPGPFNVKEHVLITIFAGCGYSGVYAIHIVTIIKAYYHKKIPILLALILSLTTQMMGYGWAGIFRKYLVDSPYMWWPGNLVQVSLYSALHDKAKRPKGGVTRLQFFMMVLGTCFAYSIIPIYLFPSISALSFVCWIWKDSITAQIIGSGSKGLGIGSVGFDWATVNMLGSPLAYPGFVIINTLVGYALCAYLVVPLLYWTNTFDARKFPIITSYVYDSTGAPYNLTRVLNEKTFDFNTQGFEGYSKLYLSIYFALNYGLNFATFTATLSYVALYYGRSICDSLRRSSQTVGTLDIHGRLMKKFEAVPQWWFLLLLGLSVALAIFSCEGFDKQLQLPWWGVLLACALAILSTMPFAVIQATTNQSMGLNVISDFLIGYMIPGKPLANMVFKTYGNMTVLQAVGFLADFKLGYYMKIPPKDMFIAQIAGTLVTAGTYLGTIWWLLSTVEHICDPKMLPEGSPWTCAGDDVFYNASIIWGIIGPQRMFGQHGVYGFANWFFLVGLVAPLPVWYFARKYPDKKWISLIMIPVILGAPQAIPPAKSVNYNSWFVVGIFFSFYVYRKHKGWWARNNYILSAALDAGTAVMGIFIFFSLQMYDIYGIEWWGLSTGDHFPLASCPTAPGIVVEGCPVF